MEMSAEIRLLAYVFSAQEVEWRLQIGRIFCTLFYNARLLPLSHPPTHVNRRRHPRKALSEAERILAAKILTLSLSYSFSLAPWRAAFLAFRYHSISTTLRPHFRNR